MKTATPPKGVTARWVSRRITRSPESRAVISRGTSLSEMFASTPLYRKHLRAKYSSASEFRFSDVRGVSREEMLSPCGHVPSPVCLTSKPARNPSTIAYMPVLDFTEVPEAHRSEEHTSE